MVRYHVEVILAARVVLSEDNESVWEYLIKWYNYDENFNSWEPAENVENCDRLVESFWANVGMDNKDHFVGDVLYPTAKWIEKEKAYFASNYVPKEKKSKKRVRSRSANSPGAGATAAADASNSKETSSAPSNNLKEAAASSSALRLDTSGKDAQQVADELFGDSPQSDSDPDRTEDHPVPSTSSKPSTSNAHVSKKRKVQVDSSSDEEPLANSVAPKKPQTKPKTHIQTIQRTQRHSLNPQAKIGRLAPSEIPVQSSGISTKQRIGQNALAPTNPREMVSSSKLKPPLRKESLGNLKFTKTRPASDALANAGAGASAAGTSTAGPSTGAQTGGIRPPTLAQYGQSAPIRAPLPARSVPKPAYSSPSVPFINPTRPPILNTTAPVPGPTSYVASPATPVVQSPMLAQATQFLQNMMPPPLAEPIQEHHTEAPQAMPAKPTRIALPTRIFNWHGELHLTSESQTETCKVQISNVSPAEGLGLATVFQGVQVIEAAPMYDFADFEGSLMAVFQPPSQRAHLSAEPGDETTLLAVTAAYMAEYQKVFLFPIVMSDQPVGQVAFIPSVLYNNSALGQKWPAPASKGGVSLICALLRYTLTGDHIKYQPVNEEVEVKRLPKEDPISALTVPKSTRLNISQTTLHRAARAVRFPPKLYNYLSDGTNRPYTIWTGQPVHPLQPQPIVPSEADVDTLDLKTVLDAAGIRQSKLTESRSVFIHVGALDSVYKLPGFSDRRGTKLWVYFYTYGTSPKVDPSLWGIREIWKCGGIVTFTPGAIARDPIGVRNLVVQISRHPLWACYVLPSALGAAIAEQSGSRNPHELLSQKEMLITRVLQSIEEGNIALLEAPPEKWNSDKDGRAQWTNNYASLLPPTQSEALSQSVKAFTELQARISRPIDLAGYIITEISQDLSRMERNPAFMQRYRRYVVIQDEGDVNFKHNDGLEWLTISKFDFADEFFPKQSVGHRHSAVEQSA